MMILITQPKKLLFLCVCTFVALTSGAQTKPEFRGLWIATVDNIDWPSKGNFSPDSQRREYIRLLDMMQQNGFNAAIVQVRPAADAFFPSSYEPWSEWLTGTQGAPPQPFYDPLEFMITETHKRGMEFHAWVNPYRAVFNIGTSSLSATHVTRLHPDWFLPYGDKRYFDPGNKDAQRFVGYVIRDLVSRYPVDAIHMDDYFYPYRITGKEFPDNHSFRIHGNGMSKDDWRRSNTDSIIALLSRTIKNENPKCQFGISPFGIWRNANKDSLNGSMTNGGSSNYDDLFADILLWLRKGWIDYVAPQIYWEFEHRVAPFSVLLDWWSKHSYGKNCYIGLGMYKAGTNPAWKNRLQLPRQIEAIRKTPNIHGMVIFSAKSVQKNMYGWSDSLRLNYFKEPAPAPPIR